MVKPDPTLKPFSPWLLAGDVAAFAGVIVIPICCFELIRAQFPIGVDLDVVNILVLFPPLTLFAWLGHRKKMRLRRARQLSWLACERCMYDLGSLDESGVCPECGRPYERERVRARWERLTRSTLWRDWHWYRLGR